MGIFEEILFLSTTHRVHYSILADRNNTIEKELDTAEAGRTTSVDTGERTEKGAF